VGTDVYIDFGSSGVYRYREGALTKVSGADVEELYGVGTELYGDFGSGVGLYSYDGTTWSRMTKSDAEGMALVGADFYANFAGLGVYRYAEGAWSKVSGSNAEQLLGVGSDLYGDFGAGVGLYRYDGTKWTRLYKGDSEGIVAVGSVLYVDFGSVGLYRYAKGAWKRISAGDAEALCAVGSNLYADFGAGTGLYEYANSAWKKITGNSPEVMSGAGSDLYAGFGASGVYRHVGGVLKNDVDVDGDLLTAMLMSDPINGSVVLNANGSFTYTPTIGFTGVDGFTYKVSDGELESEEGSVTIVVRAAGENLAASEAPGGSAEEVQGLRECDLEAITEEAIRRWTEALELDRGTQEMLGGVSFQVVDFGDLTLGRAIEGSVLIDVDAGGWGWYVDTTPWEDLEFGLSLGEWELMALESSPAFGRMDLLTVVMHELGHVLGFEDLDPNAGALMSGSLEAGVRRLAESGGSNQAVPVTEAEGYRSLVSMDRVPDGDISEKSADTKATERPNSWLMEMLLEGGVRAYNPFEPTEKIRVTIGDQKEGSKKYH